LDDVVQNQVPEGQGAAGHAGAPNVVPVGVPAAIPAVAQAAVPLPVDPGMWLSMVNVRPPQLLDLEVESMKSSFWSISDTLIYVLSR